MRIGERLIADGLATSEQIEHAIKTQIIQGGRLGTNMVELFRFPLDTLADALARQRQMPAATERHFERCDQELQRKLSADLAARWHAIPLGLLPGDRRRVAVAVSDPLPAAGIDALSSALDAEVVLAIAPELRILYFLERTYGISRLNRFVRVPSARGAPAPDERRRYVQTLTEAPASAPNALARIAVRKIAVTTSGESTASPEDITSLESGLREMRRVNSRSRLGNALMRTLGACIVPPYRGALVMIIRGGIANGWNGVVDGGHDEVIDSLALAVNDQPTLERALTTHELARAAPIADTVHQRLWESLGIAAPEEIVVAPVIVRNSGVAAIMGFADAGTDDRDLRAVARALAKNFERLYRAAER